MVPLWRFVRSLWASRKVSAVWALFVGLAGTAIFAAAVSDSYPVRDWLLWDVAKLWGWLGLFSIACASFGQFVIERILKVSRLTALESAMLGMATGTVSFVLGLYVGGAFGLFNARYAVALPLLMLAFGWHDGWRLARRVRAEAREARTSWLSWVVTISGLLLLSLVYLGALTPDTISTDASMVHMRISEDYARTGRLIPFVALYHACVPHLASLLFTWGFIVPGLSAAQHWMLALHLEFCMFLWTLVGVSAAVQRAVGDCKMPAGWVALFLFPGIFASDSNLGGSADHVVAFFSVAIALATLHVCKDFSKGRSVLLGIASAGALLTKYQAVYLVASAAVVVAAAWLHRCFKELFAYRVRPVERNLGNLLWAPVIVAVTIAVLVSPHFIKNAVFYHNPVYPFLQETFHGSTPKFPNAPYLVDHLYEDHSRVPQGTLDEKLWHAIGLFFTFSFKPHYFIKDTPYFGSLFTLLLPGLAFLRGRSNIVRLAVIGVGSVLLWGMTFNVDRNLQTFMPVLACVTGGLIVKMWQLGWLARVGLVPLIGFQVAWGGDLPVFDGRGDRIRSAMELVASGQEGHAKERFDGYRSQYVALGEAASENARLLLHLGHDALGIDREVWLDRPGFQGLVSYQAARSPRELFDYYQSLGITHVILDAREDHPAIVQDEILIRTLLHRYAASRGKFGPYQLWALPKWAPANEPPYNALALGVTAYSPGLYSIQRLNAVEYLGGEWKQYRPPEQPATPSNLTSLLAAASTVVMKRDYAVSDEFRDLLNSQFDLVNNWAGECALYVKRR